MSSKFFSKSRLSKFVVAFLVASYGVARANASGVSADAPALAQKLSIVFESKTNSDTGATEFVVENPNGFATINFISGGLKIKYQDSRGKSHDVEIFSDYTHERPGQTESEAQNIFNDIFAKMIQDGGQLLPGQVLRSLAARTSAAGGQLILKFDRSRKIGFVVSEYTLADVTLLGAGSADLTLEHLIYQIVASKAKTQVEAIFTSRQAAPGAAEFESTKPNPIGFLWDQTSVKPATAALGTGVCSSLFAASPR